MVLYLSVAMETKYRLGRKIPLKFTHPTSKPTTLSDGGWFILDLSDGSEIGGCRRESAQRRSAFGCFVLPWAIPIGTLALRANAGGLVDVFRNPAVFAPFALKAVNLYLCHINEYIPLRIYRQPGL
jgi:hypothetical protein